MQKKWATLHQQCTEVHRGEVEHEQREETSDAGRTWRRIWIGLVLADKRDVLLDVRYVIVALFNIFTAARVEARLRFT